MKLGMLAGEVRRASAAELFEAISAYGFTEVQLDLSSISRGQTTGHAGPTTLKDVREQAMACGIDIVAVNGTYNMIHPDPAVREDGRKELEVVAQGSRDLGCRFVTLCTGTRNLESMWRWHADNLQPEAWADLLASMEQVLEIAERYDLRLGIETEASNVVNSPERARRLLDEMRSPRLKIIMDVANLFQRGDARPENVRPIIDNAFALLGRDIQIAHGKDIKAGDGLAFTHAGNGIIDFGYFCDKLRECGYTGGMLVHGIKDERCFPQVVSYMAGILAGHQC